MFARRYLSTSLNRNKGVSNDALQKLFESKVALGKTLPPLTDNKQKLALYALFKQATVGANTTSKPGMLDFVGKFKWEAWTNLGDMSQEDAMKSYVDEIDSYAASTSTEAASLTEDDDNVGSGNVTKDIMTEKTPEGLFRIQLNRPKKFNALNWGMYRSIQKAIEDAENDSEVRAILLCSTGKMFCSGNDLSMFTPSDSSKSFEDLAAEGAELLEDFVNAFITCKKPIVAAIQGPAIGISVTILAHCDIVYAKENVTFHTPFSALGQSPEACSSVLFPEIMGRARANAMLLMGEKISAKDAKDCGLVTDVFGSDFESRVNKKVQTLTSLPPKALQKSKKLIRGFGMTDRLKEVNREECKLLEKLWVSEECMQAMMSFASRKN